MSTLTRLWAHMILDSRGFPTVQAHGVLSSGEEVVASVPSGASVGQNEAHELRDGGETWGGQGVDKAVAAVNGELADILVGQDPTEQKKLDELMITLDGTPTKERLGANALLAASMILTRAGAKATHVPLYTYIAHMAQLSAPTSVGVVPMFNVINGGKHANNNLRFQEFMVEPVGFDTALQKVAAGVGVYAALKQLLLEAGLNSGLGDEGGFAPKLAGDVPEETALQLLIQAIAAAGYSMDQVRLGLDVAASSISESFDFDYAHLIEKFPLATIEDPYSEEQWNKWPALTAQTLGKITIIGDDLLTTNPRLIRQAIEQKSVSGVLIKLNQIGTVTETLEAISLAQEAGYKVAVSHRSGETSDSFIADLAVAVDADYLKAGAPARGERVAKYNRLMDIERELPGS